MVSKSTKSASGGTGRRSGLKIHRPHVFAGLRTGSGQFNPSFSVGNRPLDLFALVRGVRGGSEELALGGHHSSTFRMVLVALVLDAAARFLADLKRRFGGCLEYSGASPRLAQRLSLELACGPVSGSVITTCPTRRCVRPAHLEVRS